MGMENLVIFYHNEDKNDLVLVRILPINHNKISLVHTN